MRRLEGKVAIITGGASGIGAATMRRFAAEGAAVVCADLDDTGAASLVAEIEAAGGRAAAHRTDVGVLADVEAAVTLAVQRFGGLDIMHNNAVWSGGGYVHEIDPDVWDRSMQALTDCARGNGWTPTLSAAWLKELRALEGEKWGKMQGQLTSDEAPCNPLRVCAEVDRLVTRDTILIGDGGDFVGSAANVLRPRGFGHWLDAGPLGTLGAGPGYAMAAKLASPKSDVIIMAEEKIR